MRVTSKGQVTIPLHLRRRKGIRTGSEVEFSELDEGLFVSKAKPRKGARSAGDDFEAYLDEVTGIVDLGMTTDEFMELLRGE